MFHMKPPAPAAAFGLLLALALALVAFAAGCTLLLVEPACFVGCQAIVAAPAAPAASGGGPRP